MTEQKAEDLHVEKAGFVVYGDVAGKPDKARIERDLARLMKQDAFISASPEEQDKLIAQVHKTHTPKERYVVAPFTEGRFGVRDKYYALPKGTVDPISEKDRGSFNEDPKRPGYERPIITAMREGFEETKISVEELLGEAGMKHLNEYIKRMDDDKGFSPKGVKLLIDGPEFKGIEVQLAPISEAVSYDRDGTTPLRTQLFALKLADGDILKLKDRVKNPLKSENSPRVAKHQAMEQVVSKDTKTFPTFGDLMGWMREGVPKQSKWNKGMKLEAEKVTLKGNENGQTFRDIEHQYMRQLIANGTIQRRPDQKLGAPNEVCQARNYQEWDILFHNLPAHHRDSIMAWTKQIRGVLKEQNIIGEDGSNIKIDTKDTPLNFYQESAELIPLKTFFERTVAMGEKNPAFGDVMLGARLDNQGNGLLQRLERSQMGMMTGVARVEDIRDSSLTSAMKMGLEGLRQKYQGVGREPTTPSPDGFLAGYLGSGSGVGTQTGLPG